MRPSDANAPFDLDAMAAPPKSAATEIDALETRVAALELLVEQLRRAA